MPVFQQRKHTVSVTDVPTDRPILAVAFVSMVNSWLIVCDKSGGSRVVCGSAASLCTD
jgi:hypothetical protein